MENYEKKLKEHNEQAEKDTNIYWMTGQSAKAPWVIATHWMPLPKLPKKETNYPTALQLDGLTLNRDLEELKRVPIPRKGKKK